MATNKTTLGVLWVTVGLVVTACSVGPDGALRSQSLLGGDDCPNQAVCIYTGTDYSNSRFAFDEVGKCLLIQEGFAHKVASAINKMDRIVRFYDSSDCGATSGKQIAELSSAIPGAPAMSGSAIASLYIDSNPEQDGAPPTENCVGGVCVWEDPFYMGRGLMFASAGRCFNLDRYALDYKTSSLINRTTSVAHFYSGQDCTGNEATFEANRFVDKVVYEDVIASVYIGSPPGSGSTSDPPPPSSTSEPSSDPPPSSTSDPPPSDTPPSDTGDPPTTNVCDYAVSHCRKENGKFYCSNKGNSPMYGAPKLNASTVNTLKTTWSWFSCWTTGDKHSGGNTTWYYTLGDATSQWGYLPASSIETTADFNANPSQCGLPKCSN